MKDVAALAGVSVGSVSNALNAPDKVSSQTLERVHSAIAKLGWVRNESARQLKAGRSRSVGLVMMDIANPFFTDVLRGAEDVIAARGFTSRIGNSALDRDRERAHLQLFEQDRAGGVLLAPIGGLSAQVEDIRRRGVPIVILDRVENAGDLCTVSVDDIEGGRLAVEHLLSLGHTRIAVVGGPGDMTQVRDRRYGAELARKSASADATVLEMSTHGLDARSGSRAAVEIMSMSAGERPTAIFAVNDLLAIGLLQGFVTSGFSVPGDVAIIGYDDIDFAGTAAVPLSSVRQPRENLGRRAAELLFEEIAADVDGADHRHQHEVFAPHLVVRASTDGTRAHPAKSGARRASSSSPDAPSGPHV